MGNALVAAGVQPYCVVYIQGQGYGWMSASEYDEAKKFAPTRMTMIASFATETQVREAYSRLPREKWKGIEGLHYANGEWWRTTGAIVPSPEGQALELFVPADRPVPVFSVSAEERASITA